MPAKSVRNVGVSAALSVDAFDEYIRPTLAELRVGRRVLFRRVDLEAWAASPDDRRSRPGGALPAKPPPPQLSADGRRFVRGLLSRGQRVRLGVATPDEVETEAAIHELRETRRAKREAKSGA